MGTGPSKKSSRSSSSRKRSKMKRQNEENPVLVFDIERSQTKKMPKSELDAKVASKYVPGLNCFHYPRSATDPHSGPKEHSIHQNSRHQISSANMARRHLNGPSTTKAAMVRLRIHTSFNSFSARFWAIRHFIRYRLLVACQMGIGVASRVGITRGENGTEHDVKMLICTTFGRQDMTVTSHSRARPDRRVDVLNGIKAVEGNYETELSLWRPESGRIGRYERGGGRIKRRS